MCVLLWQIIRDCVDDEDDVDALGGERDSAAARRKAALAVPDGGYGEDEDCVNAEDENYRDMLATLDREEIVKRQLYMGGEPVVTDVYDDIQQLHVYEYFVFDECTV